MAGECLVIALILGVMCVGFFRAKRKNWALAVLPLGFVPFVVGVGMIIAQYIFKADYTFMLPLILTLSSLIISCIWIGVCSQILIKTKRLRYAYIGVAMGFDFIISLIMLARYYMEFGA